MRCIVVDDEKKAREVLKQYIAQMDELDLVNEFRTPLDAISFLNAGEEHVDLIFLDINLPTVNGIQFIQLLNKKYSIIFTTAYSEYALDGYENDVVDYLLKPIRFERFAKAVYKALSSNGTTHSLAIPPHHKTFIMVKSGHDIHKVLFENVTHLRKDGNYIEIHSTTDRVILIRENMNAVFNSFPASDFIRVHKSYVISKHKIQVIKTNTVILNSGQTIPLGSSYREALVREFGYLK